MKKLYLLYQGKNKGHDTYDSCVVCADSEENAKLISPGSIHDWAATKHVKVREIGIANDSVELNSIVISSFNAG